VKLELVVAEVRSDAAQFDAETFCSVEEHICSRPVCCDSQYRMLGDPTEDEHLGDTLFAAGSWWRLDKPSLQSGVA
jgi:hypothetical protein